MFNLGNFFSLYSAASVSGDDEKWGLGLVGLINVSLMIRY